MSEWEGGERQGVRWGRIVVAIVIVALVAGGVYAVRNRNQLAIDSDGPPVGEVSETVEVVVTGPLSAGDRWYCPTTHPFAAYEEGSYYPPHYPRDAFPDGEKPIDCYAEAERAQDDGYELADPPDGVVLAGDLYLEPTRSPTAANCADLASRSSLTVPCPGRLPAPAFGPTCAQDSCIFDPARLQGLVIEHRAFAVPPEWGGGGQAQVFLTAALIDLNRAGEDGTLRIYGDAALVACSADDPVQATSRPRFVVCTAGETWVPRIQGEPHESHTAAFWRRGDIVYGASVDGQGQDADELLHALIDGITYVDPS